jgi:hypothetical protein
VIKLILGLNSLSTVTPAGGKGRVHTHTSVSMGILSMPMIVSDESFEIPRLVSQQEEYKIPDG